MNVGRFEVRMQDYIKFDSNWYSIEAILHTHLFTKFSLGSGDELTIWGDGLVEVLK
jgi:hypothetical protein